MDWFSALIAILSLVLAIISWIAKIRWSKEYKETKNERIKFLEDQVEHYKELSSTQLHDYFKSTIEEYEEAHQELQKKLKQIKEKNENTSPEYQEKLKESLKEKEVLLTEIHHRVKNNLAVISAMMNLQAFESENQEFIDEMEQIRNKVRTIANIHELIYESDSFIDVYLEKYLIKISNLYDLDISVSDMSNRTLNINQLTPLSIIINEAITQLKLQGIEKVNIHSRDTNKHINVRIDANLKSTFNNLLDHNSKSFINILIEELKGDIEYENELLISIPLTN